MYDHWKCVSIDEQCHEDSEAAWIGHAHANNELRMGRMGQCSSPSIGAVERGRPELTGRCGA